MLVNNESEKYKERGHYKNNKNKNTNSSSTSKLYLYPIIIIASILPLIVRRKVLNSNLKDFSWFSPSDTLTDYFLYYKQQLLILVAFVMFVIIIRRYYKNREFHKQLSYQIPLFIYIIFAILSTIFSTHRTFSFFGVYGQYESLLALLSYCIIVIYINTVAFTERDFKIIMKGLIYSCLALGMLGITQITGHDFLTSEIGKKLIIPPSQWSSIESITLVFEKNRVFLSLFNPNYVGTYVALLLPMLIILSLYVKNRKRELPLYILAIAGLIISLVGSKSTSGIVGIISALFLSTIFLRKYLKKYKYITICSGVAILVTLFLFNSYTNFLTNQIDKLTSIHKSEPSLKAIQTNDSDITINYNNNILKVMFFIENNYGYFITLDEADQVVRSDYNPDTGITTMTDERFLGFALTPMDYGDVLGFRLQIDGVKWDFTNQTDGTYYILNQYGRLDKIVTAPSALFTGYEEYATGRGYIWSRTIPILKQHIFLGSGADTFIFEFPQNDYVNLYNYGFSSMIHTKPHNMYLQIAVQTGVISLIAFLLFYGMYFITSIRLYVKSNYESYYEVLGVSITIGTFSYMVTMFANDSSITVAPVFWTLMGIGIAVNRSVKNSRSIN